MTSRSQLQKHTLWQRQSNYSTKFLSVVTVFFFVAAATTFSFLFPSNWAQSSHPFPPSVFSHGSKAYTSALFDLKTKNVVLSRCTALEVAPGPPDSFHSREESDRFELGTNATWIRNCVIFTGKNNGTDIVHGDILLDKGIIKGVGKISRRILDSIENLTTVDADGAWVTPGLVDLHTHLGILSAPILSGAIDLNSAKGPIAPYLRSIDGLNTHDTSYELAMAGGVTSAQVLPGSSNAIGGQAFMIKLRRPKDRSSSSMLIDPPDTLNLPSGGGTSSTPVRWRHMKQACGENQMVYGNRMDTMWSFRSAYAEALKIKQSQDEYCALAAGGLWDSLTGPFPEDFRLEMLVDVLRGKVKISTHCYEAVDLDAIVRLTNEFKFNIASIHHAAEAYLVPDLLKKMWGGVPSIALFATNYRFKREAYRGSEFAPKILADEGIPVIMKSDHPVVNSRYLIYEAQQAHHFGLSPESALTAVTSTPAGAAGLAHRIGKVEEGFDADIVLWDSHPLQLGATPMKVWVDGILQIPVPSKNGDENRIQIGKGKEGPEWRQVPSTPNWDKERNKTIDWEGLPPLEGLKSTGSILFTNVKEVWQHSRDGGIEQTFGALNTLDHSERQQGELRNVLVTEGKVICIGQTCPIAQGDVVTKDLRGGVISPGLMTFGSPLGIEEISSESSTADGETYDAFKFDVPKILDDSGAVVRAIDGLMFATRNALTAYRSGVTLATASLSKPIYLAPDARIIAGLSVAFRTGAAHAMQRGAIVQDIASLHIVVGKSNPAFRGVSVSTQIASLRRLLYGWESSNQETGAWFKKAAEGVIPLVIEVDSADIMANLLILKNDIEDKIGSRMRMVFSGASESHLLAKEISDADVGVILNPSRSFPMVWDQRRILPGPPLTNDTALVTLLEHGVVVGLGIRSAWEARNTRFDVQWAILESNGRISEHKAYALVTTNLQNLLGIRGIDDDMDDLVAFEGGNMFNLSSKAVAVISPGRGLVETF
ncbi:hypothetical protein BDN70DRAFT_830235, partial [Pholiota conissans]